LPDFQIGFGAYVKQFELQEDVARKIANTINYQVNKAIKIDINGENVASDVKKSLKTDLFGSSIKDVEQRINYLKDRVLDTILNIQKAKDIMSTTNNKSIFKSEQENVEIYRKNLNDLLTVLDKTTNKMESLASGSSEKINTKSLEDTKKWINDLKALGKDSVINTTVTKSLDGAEKQIIKIQTGAGRVVTIVRQINEETGKLGTTTQKTNINYSKISTQYKNMADRLEKSLYKDSYSNELVDNVQQFQEELKKIDITMPGAQDALDNLQSRMNGVDIITKKITASFSKYDSVLRESRAAVMNLHVAEASGKYAGETQEEYEKRLDTLRAIVKVREEDIESVRRQVQNYQMAIKTYYKAGSAIDYIDELHKKDIESNVKLDAEMQKANAALAKQRSIIENFKQGFKEATARVLNYTVAYRAFWLIISTLKKTVQIAKDLNDEFTQLQMVTLGTAESIKDLRSEYSKLAYTLSASLSDVAKGAEDWLRQGKTAEETTKLLTASMVQAKVGAIESANSTEYLTAILNGYKLTAEDAMSVVDKLAQVDVKSASSVEDLAEAMEKSANSARIAGVSLNTLIGYIATVKQVTQKSASSIGESFKTMFSRMGSVAAGKFIDEDLESEYDDFNTFLNDTEKALNKVGIKLRDTNQSFRSFEDVLNEVAASWNTYSDVEKSGIATSIAGVRQRENFLALMENYSVAMNLATEAENSNGKAMEKYAIYQDSITASLDRLYAMWQTLVSKIDLETLLKNLLSIAEVVMKIFSNEIIANIIKWGSGLAILYGVFVQLKGVLKTLIAKDEAGILASLGFWGKAGAAAGASPVTVILGIVTALYMLISVIDALVPSLKEMKQELSSSMSDLDGYISQVESLTSSLEEKRKEIEESKNTGSQENTKLLEKESEEIKRQIDYYKALESIEKRQAQVQALRVYNKASKATGKTSQVGVYKETSLAEQTEDQIEQIDNLNKKLESLNEQYKSGELTEEEYTKAVEGINTSLAGTEEALKENIDVLTLVQSALDPSSELYKIIQGILDAFGALYSVSKAVEGASDSVNSYTVSLKSYGEMIDEISDKTESLTNAEIEFKKNGVLSSETVAELEKNFGDLTGVVELTDKGFVLTTGSLSTLAKTMRDTYVAAIEKARSAAIDQLNSQYNLALSYNTTTEQIKAQIKALKTLYSLQYVNKVDIEEWSAYRKSLDSITDSLDNAETNLAEYDKIFKQITKETKESTKSSEDVETEYEARIRILEHQLTLSKNMEEIYNDDISKYKEYLEEKEKQSKIYLQLEQATHNEATRLRKLGYSDNSEEIEELQEKWWEYYLARKGLAEEENDYEESLIEEQISSLTDAIDKLIEKREKEYDNLKDYYEYEIDKVEAIKTLSESYFGTLNNISSEMRSINSELETSKASYKYLDDTLRETLFNEEDYDKLSEKLQQISNDATSIYENYMNELSNLSEDDIYKVEEITNEFERQYELKMKEYEIAKAELSLVKAQTELQNVLSNRNVRMFLNGSWIWTSDYSKVQESMQSVAEAEEDLETAKTETEQEKIIQQYEGISDLFSLQKDVAEKQLNNFTEMWDNIKSQIEGSGEDINSILSTMSESDLPRLQEIVNLVSNSLDSLFSGVNTPTSSVASITSGDTSSSGMTYKEYLENKVKWKEAMDSGDTTTASSLNQINSSYRKDVLGGIEDTISSQTASQMLAEGKYDNGGILTGIGGIKATNEDETVFDSNVTSKILDPEKSKEFLNVSNGLSDLLDNSSKINSIIKILSSFSDIESSAKSTSDSHDIYLPSGFLSSISKSDSSTISSIIKRYIPLTN